MRWLDLYGSGKNDDESQCLSVLVLALVHRTVSWILVVVGASFKV